MKVLMVCLGNICRSPMAEGVFRKKAGEKKIDISVDSAGTAPYHIGQAPDSRAIAVAKEFGVDISTLRGRQFTNADFDRFDKIFVMDHSNLSNVLSLAKDDVQKGKVKLLLELLNENSLQEVPDPWFGGPRDFHDVFLLLDRACDKLADSISASTSVNNK